MPVKEHIKDNESLDSTIALVTEGYLFIKNKIDQYQTNAFETRLFGKKVICMSGEEAAKIFYNAELFQRNGAMPKRIQRTLVMKASLNLLVNKIEYEVPKQDLSFSMTKMPTLPESGFIMNKIKRKF